MTINDWLSVIKDSEKHTRTHLNLEIDNLMLHKRTTGCTCMVSDGEEPAGNYYMLPFMGIRCSQLEILDLKSSEIWRHDMFYKTVSAVIDEVHRCPLSPTFYVSSEVRGRNGIFPSAVIVLEALFNHYVSHKQSCQDDRNNHLCAPHTVCYSMKQVGLGWFDMALLRIFLLSEHFPPYISTLPQSRNPHYVRYTLAGGSP